jgi:hypothetical protein
MSSNARTAASFLVRIACNSCRDRHCRSARAWRAPVGRRSAAGAVHVVPASIAAIADKSVVYDIVFKAAAETIRLIAAAPKYLGAETGMIAIRRDQPVEGRDRAVG